MASRPISQGMVKDVPARGVEMLDINERLCCAFQGLLEDALALNIGDIPEIVLVEIEKIEGVVEHTRAHVFPKLAPQSLKIRQARGSIDD